MTIANSIPHEGSEALVKFLRSLKSYPGKPREVQVVETHISWVFLTPRRAYKLKKPVQFDFLDFSTPEARRRACQDEVRLNRRLAKGVYLGVVPVTQSRGRFQFSGKGTAVDWVVKMHRLPAERMLDHLIRQKRDTTGDIDRLSRVLTKFYRRASPVSISAAEYRAEIDAHIRANRQELLTAAHRFPPELVKRVHTAQLRFVAAEPRILEDRVRQRRIIEGHGDLRPEHVCLLDVPVVYDCVEFNSELRTVDVIDELAFLAMECDFLGAPMIGKRVIDAYCAATGDRPPARLIDFYQCYRACVRAKVAAIRSQQLAHAARRAAHRLARRYLDLADRYRRRLGPPTLIVVRGLMGSGKSTLAKALADTLGGELLQTDLLRRAMFGLRGSLAEFNEGVYQPSNRDRVYEEMLGRADGLLQTGLSVVLDGTFLHARWRAAAAELGARHGAQVCMVRCTCSDEIARKRIAVRAQSGDTQSDARPELYELQQRQEEPDPVDLPPSLVVDTSCSSATPENVLTRLTVR